MAVPEVFLFYSRKIVQDQGKVAARRRISGLAWDFSTYIGAVAGKLTLLRQDGDHAVLFIASL